MRKRNIEMVSIKSVESRVVGGDMWEGTKK